MSGHRRSVLLIAYKFPPYGGVGALRWSKLSKYLARLGHDIHVVTVAWPEDASDGVGHGINIHRIPSGSPHRLRHRPLAGRWLPIARYLAFRVLDYALYFDDEAQRWGRHLDPACQQLIEEHGIEVVIATGHPFQDNLWAARLRRRLPDVRLVQDFRDPWADNPFRSLRGRRAQRVREWQREAVNAADAVVAVTPSLLRLYVGDSPEKRATVIANGVDPEDTHSFSGLETAVPPPIRLTHIGNISNGRDVPLAALLNAVRALPSGLIEVVLVGAMLGAIARENQDLVDRGALRVLRSVPRTDALRYVAESHYALQLNAREFPYLVSTKIYEYAFLRVPAISLNYGGEVDRLVRERGFGYSVDLSRKTDLAETLRKLSDRAVTGSDGNLGFDVEPFTYPVLAAEYSALIESL